MSGPHSLKTYSISLDEREINSLEEKNPYLFVVNYMSKMKSILVIALLATFTFALRDEPRYGAASVVFDGLVIVTGGIISDPYLYSDTNFPDSYEEARNDVYVWDPGFYFSNLFLTN